jgi:hypothetical protein
LDAGDRDAAADKPLRHEVLLDEINVCRRERRRVEEGVTDETVEAVTAVTAEDEDGGCACRFGTGGDLDTVDAEERRSTVDDPGSDMGCSVDCPASDRVSRILRA